MANVRGEKIIVRAYGNRPLVRLIWDVCEDSVLVTNDHGITSLEAGEGGPMPIGFPFRDVFVYEEENAEKIMGVYASGGDPQWKTLKQFKA